MYQINRVWYRIYLLKTTEDAFCLDFIGVSSEKQHTVLFNVWDNFILLVEGNCKAVVLCHCRAYDKVKSSPDVPFPQRMRRVLILDRKNITLTSLQTSWYVQSISDMSASPSCHGDSRTVIGLAYNGTSLIRREWGAEVAALGTTVKPPWARMNIPSPLTVRRGTELSGPIPVCSSPWDSPGPK